uniref:Sialin n=1 Tax=Cacopsylla melanoneura TaxID=428564 RepID=A0A8D9BK70_9HEMI
MAWEKFHHQRYLLATMGFLAVVVAYALRACLNMCITVMVKDPKKPDSKADFDWDQKTQGYILGSFYIGYAIMHVPGGYLAQRFGGKQTLGIGIVITASFTILTPLAANAGAVWFIVLRICMGLGEGTTFPGLNQLLAAWIPLRERSRVGAFVFAGTQVGISFANTVSGYILHFTDNNWAVAFYFFGILGIIWYGIHGILLPFNPCQHVGSLAQLCRGADGHCQRPELHYRNFHSSLYRPRDYQRYSDGMADRLHGHLLYTDCVRYHLSHFWIWRDSTLEWTQN